MPAKHPRIQVTVDPELAEAIAAVDRHPPSKSRLLRDLALRGARSLEAERERRGHAHTYLLRILGGETDYDFEAARQLHEARGEQLG